MNSFVLKMVLFCCFTMLLVRLTGIFLPRYWENPYFGEKKAYVRQATSDPFNTLFFGSSRTYRQIDPILFDSLNENSGIETRSFLMANFSTFITEDLYQISEILREPEIRQSIRYLFLEVDDLVIPGTRNPTHPRSNYYVNIANLPDFIKRVWDDQAGKRAKVDGTFRCLQAALLTTTEFGYGKHKLRGYFNLLRNKGYPDFSEHGYAPLTPGLAVQEGYFKDRRQALLSDTMFLTELFEEISQDKSLSTSHHRLNRTLLQSYLDLNQVLKEHHITLIYLLPLRGYYPDKLLALFNALPGDQKLDLREVAMNEPRLQTASAWFDRGHLNAAGARIYTARFAKTWQTYVKSQQLSSQ